MPSTLKVILTTLAAAVTALVLSPVLWPPAPGLPSPTGAQLPLFVGLAVLSALVVAWFFLATLRHAGRLARGAGQQA